MHKLICGIILTIACIEPSTTHAQNFFVSEADIMTTCTENSETIHEVETCFDLIRIVAKDAVERSNTLAAQAIKSLNEGLEECWNDHHGTRTNWIDLHSCIDLKERGRNGYIVSDFIRENMTYREEFRLYILTFSSCEKVSMDVSEVHQCIAKTSADFCRKYKNYLKNCP